MSDLLIVTHCLYTFSRKIFFHSNAKTFPHLIFSSETSVELPYRTYEKTLCLDVRQSIFLLSEVVIAVLFEKYTTSILVSGADVP